VRRLLVVGQGYVGLPVGIRACEVGFDVVGFDTDQARVQRIMAGDGDMEDVTRERLDAAVASGRYLATIDPDACAGFDVAVISVPTPLLEDGSPDLHHIEDASRTVGTHLRAGGCVVLESTTYPGTTEELCGPILEEVSGLVAGRDFHLGYSPERIDPANPTWRFENTPKVVSGIDEGSLAAVVAFYEELVEVVVPVSGTREAELTKLLENTFRHVNIALVNELAIFANDLGIDIWESIDAASTKPFGYLRFTPGPGVGGHCLPIDPSYLSWHVKTSLGHTFQFVELANTINAHMPDHVVRRLQAAFNDRALSLKERTVLLVGLAYKRNTGDARDTPALPIARLLQAGGAEVWATDPLVADEKTPPGVRRVDLDADVVRAVDAVVLLVDHDDLDLEMVAREATLVLDTRRAMRGPNVLHL
jgi:UDP-N-acetyl-D-glucosamine dehydrogenase